MKDECKISIIVPCYNSEKYLHRCIESIINQTYKNIEIILINDGSTDKTLEILEEFQRKDDRILIINKANSGVSDSRNIGIDRASGRYIMFVDADDFLEINAVQILYDCSKKNKADVVRARYKRIENNNIVSECDIDKYNNFNIKKLLYDILSGKLGCYVWALIIKKDFLIKNNLKFDNRLTIMEDQLFYINILLKGNIYFCNNLVYNYVINATSATQNMEKYVYIYSEMLKAKEIILKTLESNRLLDDMLRNTANNTIIVNGVCYSLWNLYKSGNKEIYEEFLSYIEENNKINSTLKNISYKKIRIDKIIELKLIINKKYNILKLFYGIKLIIYKLVKGSNK